MQLKKKAKSPYQKYGKTPHRYSETFNQWQAAVKRQDQRAVNQLGREHTAKYGNPEAVALNERLRLRLAA